MLSNTPGSPNLERRDSRGWNPNFTVREVTDTSAVPSCSAGAHRSAASLRPVATIGATQVRHDPPTDTRQRGGNAFARAARRGSGPLPPTTVPTCTGRRKRTDMSPVKPAAPCWRRRAPWSRPAVADGPPGDRFHCRRLGDALPRLLGRLVTSAPEQPFNDPLDFRHPIRKVADARVEFLEAGLHLLP